jgi:excisionase family DNA binding protein
MEARRVAMKRSAAPAGDEVPIRQEDAREIQELYQALQRKAAKLVSPDGETRSLPASLHSFLVELLDALSQGRSIAVIQSQAKLTTVEASAILGVSRQFFVNLLEKGELPYHMVGTHRRIYARDLFKYKAKRDAARRKALEQMVRDEVADGTYDEIPVP